jgi:hypothetical protein
MAADLPGRGRARRLRASARWLVSGLALLLGACGDDSAPGADVFDAWAGGEKMGGEPEAGKAAAPSDADGGVAGGQEAGEVASPTSALREELQGMIQRSACGSGGGCPLITVTATAAAAAEASRGRRILLIDEAIQTAAASRYRSRALGYLVADQDGTYREHTPSLTVGRDAYQILTRVDEEPGEVAARALNLAGPFLEKFHDVLPDIDGHGADILAFLAEKIPQAQFLIAEDLKPLAPVVECVMLDEPPSDDGAAWRRHDARVGQLGSSLRTLIERHGINYLHLSWGIAHGDLTDDFQRLCQRPAPAAVTGRLMEPYLAMFRQLGTTMTPGRGGQLRPLAIFQAGKAVSAPEQDRLDCAALPGRVRVYSVPYAGTEVPCPGTREHAILQPELRARLACLDVLMVMGYTSLLGTIRPGKYFSYTPLGMGEGLRPAWPPTPSFAKPHRARASRLPRRAAPARQQRRPPRPSQPAGRPAHPRPPAVRRLPGHRRRAGRLCNGRRRALSRCSSGAFSGPSAKLRVREQHPTSSTESPVCEFIRRSWRRNPVLSTLSTACISNRRPLPAGSPHAGDRSMAAVNEIDTAGSPNRRS